MASKEVVRGVSCGCVREGERRRHRVREWERVMIWRRSATREVIYHDSHKERLERTGRKEPES